MNVNCFNCGTSIATCDCSCSHTNADQGVGNLDSINSISSHGSSNQDTQVEENTLSYDDSFELVFGPGMELAVTLKKDFDESRLLVKVRNSHKVVEDALCPNHKIGLRQSTSHYYCPVKQDDGTPCLVRIPRKYKFRNITQEEATNFVDGIPMIWDMADEDGVGVCQMFAEWDFDLNKIVISGMGFSEYWDPLQNGEGNTSV